MRDKIKKVLMVLAIVFTLIGLGFRLHMMFVLMPERDRLIEQRRVILDKQRQLIESKNADRSSSDGADTI